MNIEPKIKKLISPHKYFSFWDTVCFTRFIYNQKKRNFITIISQVIDNKLSVEYLLKLSNKFETLKKITLDNEQHENFENLSQMTLEEQMKEFGIKYEN